jgi:hypothetical protein
VEARDSLHSRRALASRKTSSAGTPSPAA